MADLATVSPPGDYPVVVVGSGPGGLQMSHLLAHHGIDHAVISRDNQPGGMFQQFPLFQRLVTWTKPHPPVGIDARGPGWFDWNSLLMSDSPDERLLDPHMDGTSYFPARSEMEQGLRSFADTSKVAVRYGCTWEGTRREGDRFVLETSDGEFRCKVIVFAVGMTKPWRPDIEGLDQAVHYADVRAAGDYVGRRVLIVGKRNSGFEIADGLLPIAKQLIIVSPRPARFSVMTRSTAAARVRYMQPYEDHVLAGGNIVLDASVERVVKTESGFRAHLHGTTRPGELVLDVDDVIAATGFTTPLGDLPAIGVKTFYQERLPTQTPFWESATVPGIYFAGSITQGAIGLKKYGIPSSSAAVHGFRYNARVLARHIAETHFGLAQARTHLSGADLVGRLLDVASSAAELWNQQSYLAHVVEESTDGFEEVGLVPLASFVDGSGPDGVAVCIETDGDGEIHPCVYVRRATQVTEVLLEPTPLHDFRTTEHRKQLTASLQGFLGR